MSEQLTATKPRRLRAYVSVLGTTLLHQRNPWVIAFWSAMFPGLGHLLLSKHLRGLLLFGWEILINVEAHVNTAIYYGFTGQFDLSASVLEPRWVLLYIPTYLFAIFDSYRTAVDINQTYTLAAREDARVEPFRINGIELNYLDKIKPWVVLSWSFLTPGAGQLYIHRIVTAFFIMAWFIVISYYSNLLPAIYMSMLGKFELAKTTLNLQWFLNVPSVYFFAIFDAYSNSVENNKLFEWEQSRFLKREYENPGFRMPISREGGEPMYVISTFEHSRYLEMAITALQMKGIAKESILAVSMDKRTEIPGVFDTGYHSDGHSFIDLALILGAFCSLLGSIYGFLLDWGPIIWGIIGMIGGIGLGLLIKRLIYRNEIKEFRTRETDVVVIVSCEAEQVEMVKDMLWVNHAFGVRKLALGV